MRLEFFLDLHSESSRTSNLAAIRFSSAGSTRLCAWRLRLGVHSQARSTRHWQLLALLRLLRFPGACFLHGWSSPHRRGTKVRMFPGLNFLINFDNFIRLPDYVSWVEIFQNFFQFIVWNLPRSVCCFSLQHWQDPQLVLFWCLQYTGEYKFINKFLILLLFILLKLDLNEMFMIVAAALFLTLFIEYAFCNLKKLLLDSDNKKTLEVTRKDIELKW